MFHFYLKSGDHVLLVDGAKVGMDKHDLALDLRFENCALSDVIHLGGGIYDMIVFPTRPPNGILKKAFEKIYWGGYVIILGIEDVIKEVGYGVVRGSPDMLVLRRPPAPPNWSEEYYLEFQERGRIWNADTKEFHPAYRKKFAEINFNWNDATVIELGCGRGEITRQIALAGAKHVYAIDSSPTATSLTERFCEDCENVSACQDNALKWKTPSPADIIVAIDFVEHIEEIDLPILFRRMYENLKKNGVVHIVTPAGPDHVRDHRWHPTSTALKKKMEEVGFKETMHHKPKGSRKFIAAFKKV